MWTEIICLRRSKHNGLDWKLKCRHNLTQRVNNIMGQSLWVLPDGLGRIPVRYSKDMVRSLTLISEAQPQLKSWGVPRFGSWHRGARTPAPRPARSRAGMGVRGRHPSHCGGSWVSPPENYWQLRCEILHFVTTMLISGLPRTCISEQTTSMSEAKSVPKFQLLCRGCAPDC